MHRFVFGQITRLSCISLLAITLAGSVTAIAQTDTTTTLTPAQQKAQAAKAARQAAAQQAAQNRAAAAQARTTTAQNKAAARTTPNAASSALPNAANAAGNMAKPGSAPGAAAATSVPKTGSAGTVGSGTLAWQTRVYSSNGCTHNGNSAVCTFTFTNQGNEATLVAGGEMQGIQLVDDAHVPHKTDSAHFLDKYGTQQPRLLVQPGDTGTYILTFPNVNSQVSTADFHLRQQVVGGVTFGSSASGASSTAAKATQPGATGSSPSPK